jgi:hypothetical protein
MRKIDSVYAQERSGGHKTVLFNYLKNYFKKGLVDFHGGTMVETSSSAGGVRSIPGQEVKIPQDPTGLVAKNPKKHNRQKQYCNKFNKQVKNGPHKKQLKKEVHLQ